MEVQRITMTLFQAISGLGGRLLALAMLIVVAPVIFLAAILIKLTSPGPVLFIQRRVGLNGRLFRMYKLRTMYHATPLVGTNARRVTPIGKQLRRLSRFDTQEWPTSIF